MTKAEYLKAYREAKATVPRMSRKAMTELKQAYKSGAETVAEALRGAVIYQRPDYVQETLASLHTQLEEAAFLVTESLSKEVPLGISKVGELVSTVDQKYIRDAVKGTDIEIVAGGLAKAVNKRLLDNLATRLWTDGYTFSQRVWRAGQSFQDDIKQVIAAGFTQGRDALKIAEDLEAYVAGGKIRLMKRFGRLEKGTSEYVRRIPRSVDYRALRIVRTELYASLKDAGAHAGYYNPGAMGYFHEGDAGPWYDWVMTAGRGHWDCECPELADGSPYHEGQIPAQPHPNCMCYITPRLMDLNELKSDLIRWQGGERITYIEVWHTRASQAGMFG